MAIKGRKEGRMPKAPRQFQFLNEFRYDHKYTTHPTYTGLGCAICGRGEYWHDPRNEEDLRRQFPEIEIRVASR